MENRCEFLKCSSSEIKGFLIDVNGVLFNSTESGDGFPIEGSVEAIKMLNKLQVPFRLCSNETQNTGRQLVAKLQRLGFEIQPEHLITPAPLVVKVLLRENLRPYLLVHPSLRPEFDGMKFDDPNCVVVGDAAEEFSYKNLNEAFRLLIEKPGCKLISMGLGKYYKDQTRGLMLDLGAYTKALEFACDIQAEVIGKPTERFFHAAVKDLNLKPNEVAMIGDDIISDVDGAQKCGIRGIQVMTGKWRPDWANHPTIKPCCIVKNLWDAVNLIWGSGDFSDKREMTRIYPHYLHSFASEV